MRGKQRRDVVIGRKGGVKNAGSGFFETQKAFEVFQFFSDFSAYVDRRGDGGKVRFIARRGSETKNFFQVLIIDLLFFGLARKKDSADFRLCAGIGFFRAASTRLAFRFSSSLSPVRYSIASSSAG